MFIHRFKYILKLFTFIPGSLLLSLLYSCSNSDIGRQLSNSFDNPIIDKTNSEIISEEKNSSSTKQNSNVKKNSNSDKKNKNTNKPRLVKQKKNSIKPKKLTFKPQPYRITIKLSGANPSAPAESVTKVLRNAGVQFEVEKIERVNNQSIINSIGAERLRR